MGVQILIGGKPYQATSYTVQEDSTPTVSDDSTGSVGQIVFELVNVEQPFLLEGKDVSLKDTLKGSTVGTVSQVSETDKTSVTVTCYTRLGKLNIYGVQAQPFSGTLGDAYRYYVGLAEQITDIYVDEEIDNLPVVFPGWYGELWYNLKLMAAAQGCEVSLVSGVLLLRPLRTREAVKNADVDRSRTYGGGTLAKSVEVYYYNNKPITNKLVYPPGGWTMETEVLSVGAGETLEHVVELSASVTKLQPLEMRTYVAPGFSSASVYTVVGDDGLPIVPKQWTDAGGKVSVKINPDTTSVTVTLTGATGIRSTQGGFMSSYSIALGADRTGNRYSTLRLVGTGVAFNKKKITAPTCVQDNLTGTDVGITVDNPFLSTVDEAWNTAVVAARGFAGESMSLSGTVTAINQLGDTGSASYPTYDFVEAFYAGKTYIQVEALNTGKTYDEVQQQFFAEVQNEFANQVFGNVNGARVWDRKTLRWYRIRSANVSHGQIQFEAEDDLLYSDVEEKYQYMTYDQVQELFDGLTYSERFRLGLWGDITIPDNVNFPSQLLFPQTDLFPA